MCYYKSQSRSSFQIAPQKNILSLQSSTQSLTSLPSFSMHHKILLPSRDHSISQSFFAPFGSHEGMVAATFCWTLISLKATHRGTTPYVSNMSGQTSNHMVLSFMQRLLYPGLLASLRPDHLSSTPLHLRNVEFCLASDKQKLLQAPLSAFHATRTLHTRHEAPLIFHMWASFPRTENPRNESKY